MRKSQKNTIRFWCMVLFAGWLAMAGMAADKILTPKEQALDFMRNETQFHLGYLPTEQSHLKTCGLSQALQTDTTRGMQMLLSVDEDILPVAKQVIASPEFAQLRNAIKEALDHKKRIFFSGCGATGRLSILLDAANRRFWRRKLVQHESLQNSCGDMVERTVAVMTGGDYALVRSVEMFEDYITFGYHQMEQAGVAEGDVVVAISEGGETSSVIGTVLRGVDAKARVFFLFNNPAQLLAEKLERCKRVIENKDVTILELCTGSMAVAGSTRMQATTIELLIAGAAFEAAMHDHLTAKLSSADQALVYDNTSGVKTPAQTVKLFETMLAQISTPVNLASLAKFVDFEADIYARKGRVTYFAADYLLDIFTDTTERAPTFKTPPFRNCRDTVSPAPWAFVKDPLRATPAAWLNLLEHEPNCLDWNAETYIRLGASANIRANTPKINKNELYGFLIGNEADNSRTEVTPNVATALLIGREAGLLSSQSAEPWHKAYLAATGNYEKRAAIIIGKQIPEQWSDTLFYVDLDIPGTPLDLFGHLAVKLALNNVSTASMGKIGRLDSNWMAHVEASNKKLIDRSVRLIVELAGVDYATACIALFETVEEMKSWDEGRRRIISPAAYTVRKLKQAALER